MRKITILSVLLVIILFSVLSCAPAVSQQEYDRVNNELSAIQSQLASLQGKLTEAESLQGENEELSERYDMLKAERETIQTQYEELSTEYEELNKQLDIVKSEFETMQAKYEGLIAEYEELSKQYDILLEEPAEFNEENVEQALFQLINQERTNNGLDALMWGKNRYKEAIAHSQYMATSMKLEYPESGSKEIYWATGYGTADEIANAALTVWKNRLVYERTFLNNATPYGAVAVYKSGEVFYITYIADYFE
jgi:archaellum component FlaC